MAKQAPNRTKAETLSLRISPDLKFGLELLARMEERSLTTEVEKALRELFNTVRIDASFLDIREEDAARVSDLYFLDVLGLIYSPDAPTRLIRTGIALPHFLSQKERIVFDIIRSQETFHGDETDFFPAPDELGPLAEGLEETFRRNYDGFDMSAIRRNWASLNEAADFTIENGHYPDKWSWAC